MIKSILFDFDGVIVDTERKKYDDFCTIIKLNSLDVKEISFKDFIGRKRGSVLASIGCTPEQINNIMPKIREQDMGNLAENKLIMGITGLLKFLHKKYFVGIVTGSNKEFVREILIHHNLEEYIDFFICGDDVKKSKPDPECYFKAFKDNNLRESEVLIIEDSHTGILAAKATGANVIGLLTYFSDKELISADYHFKDHNEILDFIKSSLD